MMNSSEHEADDLTLIKGYLAGNAGDFTALYERYKRQLYGYLNKMLNADRSKADDLFQQTWIKAIDQLPRYEHRQQFGAWLLRIAHNLAIDSFRKNGRLARYEAGSQDEPENGFDAVDNHDDPWRKMHREELERAIDQAVGKLSPELREVFLLRRENVAFKEIARIQGSSINTALARMQYALKNLRKSLAEWNE